jgi:hypothetical protein
MEKTIRFAVVAVGLLNVVLGLLFLLLPEWMGAEFYITPIGSQGLATIRADFPGFFLTCGGFAMWGALMRYADEQRVPIVLLSIALFGRVVSLILDGAGPSALPPMILEAVMIAILITGMRRFGYRR